MSTEFSVTNFTVTSAGRRLLDDVSFSIKRGSWLSIIGANGAGKSTLLKALAGLAEGPSGRSTIGDIRLDNMPQRERACYLSYVPQQFEALVPFSVDEFLRLALYAENSVAGEEKVRSAYVLFRLENFKDRSIQRLSVGEMQRVLLAAAFVQGSELLLLDEPSSALDPFEECEMLKTLSRLKSEAKRTILFVSHNLSSALTLADAVLVLKDGKVLYFGSAQELIQKSILRQAFGQDFRIVSEGRQHSVFQKLPIELSGDSYAR
jgi:iron complex transport system ATP-binding protein